MQQELIDIIFTIKGFYEDKAQPFIDHELSDVYLLRKDIPLDKKTMLSNEVDDVRYFGIEELKEGLRANPEIFVPHHEAYKRLFEYFYP